MSAPSNESDEFASHSRIYQEFLVERGEILRHKWIESEKAGRDIGFDRALLDWCIMYRSRWRAERQDQIQIQPVSPQK